MADNPSFEVPRQVRDFTESSLEQARKAFASFIGAARRTTETLHGSTDLARTHTQTMFARGLDYADQNVRAALDLAQKLASARSIPEATQIQAEFVRERFAAMQAQAQELTGLAQGTLRQGADQMRKATVRGQEALWQAGTEVEQAVENAAP